MKIGRLMRSVFALIAILFVTFQPIMVPVAYAVESWTGNPWEGNPWEGKSWDGSSLQWEGKTWTGKSTQGDSWSGKSTNGESWNGNGTDGEGTEGQDWNSEPWYMEGWTQPVIGGDPSYWVGRGTTGNPWLKPGWSGNGTTGNSFNGEITNGKGTAGQGTNGQFTYGNSTSIPAIEEYIGSGEGLQKPDGFYNNDGFKIGQYIVKDVINGQAKFIRTAMEYQDKLDAGENVRARQFLNPRRMFSDLAINGMKLGTGKTFLTNAYDLSTKVEDGYKAVRKLKAIRDARKISNVKEVAETADEFTDAKNRINKASSIAKTASKFGALSKFNMGVAAAGAAVSGYKTYDNITHALKMDDSNSTDTQQVAAWADVGASAGDTLMNAGTAALLAPVPGARIAGGIAVAAGAGLWVISKGVKLFANNWKGGVISTAKTLANKAKNKVKETTKKVWDTVTGWF